MARRRPIAKTLKAQKQILDAWKDNRCRAIVAIDYVKRTPRRPVPAECVDDLRTASCFPYRTPDGWMALDSPRTANIVASWKAKTQAPKQERRKRATR
jgi:hypothetical protein